MSKFRLNIDPVPNRPEQKYVRFSPVSEKRLYTVEARPLVHLGPFDPITGPLNDVSEERTVTDENATNTVKIYRVRIDFP